MRILFCTGSSARYMAPPQLGDEQINCGPDWLDREIGGHVVSMATPIGDYDIAGLVNRLPADQRPDAVVCLVDASWRSTPRNLQAIRCPKVLLVADTHHLTAPISGMIRYAKSEPYDRIVLLYDRHHWEFFHAAGLQQLFWFPGLTFPHRDETVRASRLPSGRAAEIAFVGQTGICHPRRIRMLSQLLAQQLPLSSKAITQRESLEFYGRSLIGFNASLNGDLNLRTFEIMAGGAMLLTDRLGQKSGLEDIWRDGCELATYGSTGEMVERAKHALAHPEEAQAIGEAGACWFDAHFNLCSRKKAFRELVFEGMPHPLFPLPTPIVTTSTAGAQDLLISGYEYVQELHRNLDHVVVAVDETVPENFMHLCATLPRVEVRRGLPEKGVRVDFLAVGRKNFGSPTLMAATHIWPWDAAESDRMMLVRRCTSMGFMLIAGDRLIFSRHRVNTHSSMGAVALVRLEQGNYGVALDMAKTELAKNPKSVEALIVQCEVGQESGNSAQAQAAAVQLNIVAPHHPRLREIIESTKESVRARRPMRLTRVARSLYEQKQWPEVGKIAQEILSLDPKSADAHYLIGMSASQENGAEPALAHLAQATHFCPDNAEYWHELGFMLLKNSRELDALGALLQATIIEPCNFLYQIALGEGALAVGHGGIAVDAMNAASRIQPENSWVLRRLEAARRLELQCEYARPRDLLLSHVEVTRLQGTGVLIERFFPDARDFVTLRSRTLYKGRVDFGGVHLSLDLPGLAHEIRRNLVRRILAPFTIRRILCVPFFASDFIHAITAQELTGAPLCTYVMDDQTLHARSVPDDLAQRLFEVSGLRLAISPEMIEAYAESFRFPFGLLPPVVVNNADEYQNEWCESKRSPSHCAMVGNIWSARQFEQLRAFVRSAALRVDWFGNSKVSWIPQNQSALEADGIFCQGFLPEPELARRLVTYPFVLLPSGALDGTEDNEWLTRLSLPSRVIFIVAKTRTPLLVLGHLDTAVARFVNRFGLGLCSSYDAGEGRSIIARLTAGHERERWIENAAHTAPHFVFPDAGAWLWRSLDEGTARTPFDELFAQRDLATAGSNQFSDLSA